MNSWASEVIAEPRDMQKTGDESIIDGVMKQVDKAKRHC